ncbi:MAG: hypothetical protein ACR2KT_04490, partial [Methylocella sp.]
APPQIKETQLPHRTAPIGQIQRDSLNLICWPRGRGIFRDALNNLTSPLRGAVTAQSIYL